MKPYVIHPFRLSSCIIMLVAFIWFTIGAPVLLIDHQRHLINTTSSKDQKPGSDNSSRQFENAMEEKKESSSGTFVSDYLQADDQYLLHTDVQLKHNKWYTAEIFAAFYGESVSPPPKISLC